MNRKKLNNTTGQINEQVLIARLKSGDTEAFASIYHLYFQRLFVYCRQFTKSRHDAEDIVQEVFTKLWTGRAEIKQDTSLRGLLFIIARNDLTSAFRRTVNAPLYEDYMDYVNSIGCEDSSSIEYREFEQRLMSVIDSMPQARRRILTMSKFDHMTNRQIADQLGINEQSVKNSLSQSLKFIRSRLKQILSIIAALILLN